LPQRSEREKGEPNRPTHTGTRQTKAFVLECMGHGTRKKQSLSWAIYRGIPGRSKHALIACAAKNIDKGYKNILKHLTILNWTGTTLSF
jgi:hypothetical protein